MDFIAVDLKMVDMNYLTIFNYVKENNFILFKNIRLSVDENLKKKINSERKLSIG